MHPSFSLVILLIVLFILWYYFGRKNHPLELSSLKQSIFEFLSKSQNEQTYSSTTAYQQAYATNSTSSPSSVGMNIKKEHEVRKKAVFEMPISGEKEFDSRPEALCCKILEELYSKPFSKIRPNFLKNPETGCNLELDCYNDELKIAVEYSGYQHYIYPNRYHKTYDDFIKQVRRDQFKIEMCDQNGIYLITVPYWVPEFKLKDFIIEHLPENIGKT